MCVVGYLTLLFAFVAAKAPVLAKVPVQHWIPFPPLEFVFLNCLGNEVVLKSNLSHTL